MDVNISAIDAFTKSIDFGKLDAPRFNHPSKTPFRFFEDLPGDASGSVRHYAALDEPDRIALAKKLKEPLMEIEGEDPNHREGRAFRRTRDLLFLIHEEARIGGSREAAAAAFIGLFGEKTR